MRRSAILLMIAVLAMPGQVWAAGAFVAGCATGGPLATPMGVSAAATKAAMSVSTQMRKVGRSISSEQRKVIASINTNFEAQNSLFRQVVASLGVSMERMENMRMFGPDSQAYGVGAVNDRFNAVMTGRRAEDKLSGYFRESISQHARESERRYQRSIYYGEKEIDSVTPAFFFPQTGTLSAEQLNNALFAIKAAADPFPTPKLPESYQGRGESMGYEAQRKAKYSRLSMPTAVISDIVSSYAPVVELGEWAEKAYSDMGGEEAPSQVVDGKISPMAYIDMMVSQRFANEQWYSGDSGIHSMTPSGVLRELAVMESVNMEMQRRQMKYMQQTAGLLAQDQATETGQRFDESLNDIYEKVARE